MLDGRSVISCYLSKCLELGVNGDGDGDGIATNGTTSMTATDSTGAHTGIYKASSSDDIHALTSVTGVSGSNSLSKLDREAVRLCKKILDVTKPNSDAAIAPPLPDLSSVNVAE